MAYAAATGDRWRGGGLAVAVTAALGWILMAGLAARSDVVQDEEVRTFAILTDPPARPRDAAVPPPRRVARPAGEAAPPNLRARPAEIAVPPPALPPLPSPVIAAPVAGAGAAPSAGATDLPGPGTGAGGIGDGLGAGGSGEGDGGGWREETPPEWIGGRIRDSDFPDDVDSGGTVSVRYVVAVDGRVSSCRVTRSSGSRVLDATTCRLIEQRFRFRPSRDARGRPVPSVIVENHSWHQWGDPDAR